MRVVVIEDEPLTSERLCEFILRYDASAEIAAKLSGIKETLAWLRINPAPDLIFADIELADGNFFAVVENAEISCPIIFTTAYDQFWLQAFEREGIAYLLKPYTYEKFAAAMQKFQKLRRAFASGDSNFWQEIKASVSPPKYKERFMIKAKGGLQVLSCEQVAYIQMRDELPFAFDYAGNKFLLKETISSLEQSLDPKAFFRINRGEIININAIRQLKPDFQDRLIIYIRNSEKTLICSKSRTPNLRKWLDGGGQIFVSNIPSSLKGHQPL